MVQPRGIGLLKVVGGTAALALVIGIVGCASSQREYDSPTASTTASTTAKSYDGAVAGAYPAEAPGAPLHTAARNSPQRAVVRQSSLTVEVENLEQAEQSMKSAVLSHGGYVANEVGENLAGEEPVLRLQIRIPEPSFDEVLGGFEKLGRRTQKSISASDVTEEILDNDARIKSLRQQQELLMRNGGGTTLNPGFDSMKDRIRELENEKSQLAVRAAMSTIDLTLQQKANAHFSSAAHASWGSDTWNSAITSALGAFRVIGALLIWALVYCPIWGGILLLAVLGMRSYRRGPKPA